MRLLWLTLLFTSVMAHAHQSSLSSTGSKVHWPKLSLPFTINANGSDLSSTQQRNIILSSIAQWNGASPAQISVGSGSISTISFTDDFDEYGSGVVGITEVSYNSSGQIQKANILLNDNYTYKSVPGVYNSDEIFLGDVVTHELGHFLGQSHSEVLDATMFYSSFSGQSTLSADDMAAVRGKYSTSYGSISGYVKGGSNIGLLGVHVQAISRQTGEVIGVFSDENGRFVISGLSLDDSYYLYTSPMKNSSSLPAYYSNVRNEFCPGSFVGSFFQACGKRNEGFPQTITLNASTPHREVGTVTINCSLKSPETYSFEKLQTSFDPVSIYDFDAEQVYEKGFVGHFRTTSFIAWSGWDLLTVDLGNFDTSANNKFLKLALTGRKLGNHLEYEIQVWHNGMNTNQVFYVRHEGSTIASVPGVVTLLPSTDTYDTDLEAMLPLSNVVGDNVYEIRIRARRLGSSMVAQMFPAYEAFSSSRYLPYLLQTSLYEELAPGNYAPLFNTASVLSDNASCLDAPFAYKISKASSPASNDNSSQAGPPGTSCGTIDPPNKNGGSGGPMLIALGFMLTVLASELMKRSKKFLS